MKKILILLFLLASSESFSPQKKSRKISLAQRNTRKTRKTPPNRRLGMFEKFMTLISPESSEKLQKELDETKEKWSEIYQKTSNANQKHYSLIGDIYMSLQDLQDHLLRYEMKADEGAGALVTGVIKIGKLSREKCESS